MANYRTVERDTRNNWIDGRSVFEKTVILNGGNALPTGLTDFQHEIADFDQLVEPPMIVARNSNSGQWLFFNHPGNSLGALLNCSVGPAVIRMNVGSNYAGILDRAHAILRYVKVEQA